MSLLTPFPRFFITGLPRSRTAWLANLLTSGGALCVHEGLLAGEARLIAWLEKDGARGLSDSTLPFCWSKLQEAFPIFRLVLVERDPGEAWQSLVSFLDREELRIPRRALRQQFELLENELARLRSTVSHLAVNFNDLDDLGTIQEIWNYCLPGLPFDFERALLLQRFNIQQHTAEVRREGQLSL